MPAGASRTIATVTAAVGVTDTVSLKAFHVFFVSVSTLLFLWIGWGRAAVYYDTGQTATLLQSIGSFAIAVGLMVYGRYVLRKLAGISYL